MHINKQHRIRRNNKEMIRILEEMIVIQRNSVAGSDYMCGMLNGMIFSLSILDGKAPKYVDPI